MNGTNLYEFIPQTPLQFQEGDIFGVYSDRTDGERLVLNEQRESGPTNLRIRDSLNSPPSTISQSLSTVNNDFPLVTVEISKSLVVCLELLFVFLGVSTKSVPVVSITTKSSKIISITSVSYELFSSQS